MRKHPTLLACSYKIISLTERIIKVVYTKSGINIACAMKTVNVNAAFIRETKSARDTHW